MSTEIMIAIDLIDPELRPASEVRVAMNRDAIGDYGGRIDKMPPIKVFVDPDNVHWLGDGAHTYTAAKEAGRSEIKAEVVEGSYLEAFRFACDANEHHGVRVTDADRRHRVEVALVHPDTKDWSQHRIAELCGVSQTTVHKLDHRRLITPNQSPVVGRDGRSYQRKTSKQSDGVTDCGNQSKGQCRVNGVIQDDTPDVAADRAAGLIPPNQIVDITEPETTTTVEDVKQDIDARKAGQGELPDEEWLASLPLSKHLKGVQLKTFQDEALVYRRAIAAVKQCGKKVAEEFNKVRRQGPLHWRWTFAFKVDDPSKWVRCAEPIEGGCGGEGTIEVGDKKLKCGQCHGHGFRHGA